jgi:hypothetical protein
MVGSVGGNDLGMILPGVFLRAKGDGQGLIVITWASAGDGGTFFCATNSNHPYKMSDELPVGAKIDFSNILINVRRDFRAIASGYLQFSRTAGPKPTLFKSENN